MPRTLGAPGSSSTTWSSQIFWTRVRGALGVLADGAKEVGSDIGVSLMWATGATIDDASRAVSVADVVGDPGALERAPRPDAGRAGSAPADPALGSAA